MEEERRVVVNEVEPGSSLPMLTALIVVLILIVAGLLFWHPWSTSTTTNTTTVTEPQNGNGSNTKSNSSTTTNAQPQPQAT